MSTIVGTNVDFCRGKKVDRRIGHFYSAIQKAAIDSTALTAALLVYPLGIVRTSRITVAGNVDIGECIVQLLQFLRRQHDIQRA